MRARTRRMSARRAIRNRPTGDVRQRGERWPRTEALVTSACVDSGGVRRGGRKAAPSSNVDGIDVARAHPASSSCGLGGAGHSASARGGEAQSGSTVHPSGPPVSFEHCHPLHVDQRLGLRSHACSLNFETSSSHCQHSAQQPVPSASGTQLVLSSCKCPQYQSRHQWHTDQCFRGTPAAQGQSHQSCIHWDSRATATPEINRASHQSSKHT